MFDWSLFLILVLACVPGLLVAIPNLMRTLEKTAIARLPPGKTLPPRPVIVAAMLLQSLLFVALAAAVGTALAPRVGLAASFFEAPVSGAPLWANLAPQLLPALVLGVGGALVIVAAYYLLFRPRLDAQTVQSMGCWPP